MTTDPATAEPEDRDDADDGVATPQDAERAAGKGVGAIEDTRSIDEVIGAFEESNPETAADLRAEWGPDFERNIDLARATARAVMTPELRDAVEAAGLGDHPELIRAAADLGRRLDAARPADNDAATGRRPPAFPARSRHELEDEHSDLVARKDRWSNKRVDRRINEIARALWGARPYQPGLK